MIQTFLFFGPDNVASKLASGGNLRCLHTLRHREIEYVDGFLEKVNGNCEMKGAMLLEGHVAE